MVTHLNIEWTLNKKFFYFPLTAKVFQILIKIKKSTESSYKSQKPEKNSPIHAPNAAKTIIPSIFWKPLETKRLRMLQMVPYTYSSFPWLQNLHSMQFLSHCIAFHLQSKLPTAFKIQKIAEKCFKHLWKTFFSFVLPIKHFQRFQKAKKIIEKQHKTPQTSGKISGKCQ